MSRKTLQPGSTVVTHAGGVFANVWRNEDDTPKWWRGELLVTGQGSSLTVGGYYKFHISSVAKQMTANEYAVFCLQQESICRKD